MTYAGPIVDVDVHHTWRSPAELYPFLDPKARALVDPAAGGHLGLDPVIPLFPHAHGTISRVDAFPADGPAGSDVELLRRQHLDRFNVQGALLTYDIGLNAGVPNPYLATALARAANRWCAETWLALGDPRLLGTILVPTQIPEEGAAEIRRHGADPRMAGALLVANGMGKPFGHPIYHPIYAAAAEMDLPVVMHVGGDQLPGGSQHIAGGLPCSRLEFTTLGTQSPAMHIASLITHGVFEKYPSTRFIALEMGVAWFPGAMWRLDQTYHLMRRESSWVRRAPSDYVRDHVRLSTQPIELSPHRADLVDVLEGFDGIEDLLLFSSDYPHWDNDVPTYLGGRLPERWLPKVFCENAAAALRLSDATRRTLTSDRRIPA